MVWKREDWNEIIRKVNELIDNGCSDTETLEEVDEGHVWTVADIIDVRDKLTEICTASEPEFEADLVKWKRDTIDEIETAIDECECCNQEALDEENGTEIEFTVPLKDCSVFFNGSTSYKNGNPYHTTGHLYIQWAVPKTVQDKYQVGIKGAFDRLWIADEPSTIPGWTNGYGYPNSSVWLIGYIWTTYTDYGPFDSYEAPIDCCGRLALLDPAHPWGPYYDWTLTAPIDIYPVDYPVFTGGSAANFDNLPIVMWLRQYMSVPTPVPPTVRITLSTGDAYCDKCDLDCSEGE